MVSDESDEVLTESEMHMEMGDTGEVIRIHPEAAAHIRGMAHADEITIADLARRGFIMYDIHRNLRQEGKVGPFYADDEGGSQRVERIRFNFDA
jgi:hypothetical protein